jgi:signal transduction histidine kinase
VVLLGVLTSVLSLIALQHLVVTSTSQRVERARDNVAEEVDHLARDPHAIIEPPAMGFVGMRAGVWDGEGHPDALPGPWVEPVRAAIFESRAAGARVAREAQIGPATLVVAAAPSARGGTVWTAMLVRPLTSISTWRWIVGLLALATALLFGTAVHSILSLKRGAAELHGSLVRLATDLDAPIPRPPVGELGDIADGIAELAQKLARARREEERLGRELARQERLAALGRVAAGIAHEVRNPLASIKLRLDLAAAGAPLPTIVERAIGHASAEIARLDRLVADLLVVAGRQSGPKAHASLGALVRARTDGLAAWSAERDVTVSVSGEGDAVIDADSVARALDNLLRNSIEASPSGGRVDVRVSTASNGRPIAIRFEDHGPGVPEARTSELFEPFFTTKPDGTGLGLAISRAIARAHGGDVTYTRDGGTTRFEMTIAAAPAVAAAKEKAA